MLDELRAISCALADVITAADTHGEPYHPGYKKDKDAYRRLTRADAKLERRLRAYFRDLNARILDVVDWVEYAQRLRQVVAGDEIIREVEFENEKLTLSVLFDDELEDTFAAGMRSAEASTGVPSGLTVKDTPAARALRAYTIRLSDDVTGTTAARVKQSLIKSLDLGLDARDAAKALTESTVIDDPYRAKMIAHTESVRSFSTGKLTVGKEIGARSKKWDAASSACVICADMDGDEVPMSGAFHSDVTQLDYEAPPAHPWCRCLMTIEM